MSTVSWGRLPAAEARRLGTRLIPAVLAIIVGLTAPVDGFVPRRSIISAQTPADVQLLLDQHLRTLQRGDDFQYQRTLDRQSPAHTRCMTEHFRRGVDRSSELQPNRLIRLEQVRADSTLVRAYVQRREGVVVEYVRRVLLVNLLTRPPFDIRRETPVWYLGSPNETELGGVFVTQAGPATVESRAIDTDARQTIKREVDTLSREAVGPPIEAPGATLRPPLRIRLVPAPEFGPNGCVNGATYDRARGEILLYPIWTDDRYSSLSVLTRLELRTALREQSQNP